MNSKNISKEQYTETFCKDKRIRNRQVLYVSSEIHEEIRKTASIFRKEHITTSSLVDTILEHHLETHKDLLNTLYQERQEQFLAEFTHRHKAKEDTEGADSIIVR